MFKKTMIYLGLGPDSEYEQHDDFMHAHAAEPADPGDYRGVDSPAVAAPPPGTATVRPLQRAEDPVKAGPVGFGSEQAPGGRAGAPRSETHPSTFSGQAVRIVETPTVKPHAVSPTSFNDAQSIGDRFKSGQPVIINLQGVNRDVRRRIVDFASGLCYALAGKMDRVADQVYLLTPSDVVVSRADARDALH